MRGWWEELGSLVLPVPCAGCGQGRALLCSGCRAALAPGPVRRVAPTAPPAGLPPVYACAGYAGPLRSVLLAHKERGALPLAAPLGALLAASVAGVPGAVAAGRRGVLELVPVPSSRSARARRGHDPLRRIALAAAAGLRGSGLAVRVRAALRTRRAVRDQTSLGRSERLANLSGALVADVRGGSWGGPVVLVDDLMTTGASLAEAARAVRESGPGRELPAARRVGPRAADGAVLGAAVVAVPRRG